MGYTPDYIDMLLPKQIFVFSSNALGYHTGGAVNRFIDFAKVHADLFFLPRNLIAWE